MYTGTGRAEACGWLRAAAAQGNEEAKWKLQHIDE
jgi:hypothetical protein